MNKNKDNRLWTPGFAILWQSQLVSTIGDAVYSIALGFWVLAVTGSTALMGALMAASTLPGVIIAPFAGVIIDNSNKKRLFIAMDMLRGVFIVLLSAAAWRGFIAVWMVFAAGILLSVCGAVFNPGVQSSVPDMVPKDKIANANSVFSILSAASNMAGYVSGGFLYQALGAPALFLFDGLSFLFSGASISFIKIPSTKKKEKVHFFGDMADGFKYMWNQKGLRMILSIAALTNFFSYIAIVLFMPYCKYTPGLGAGKYGVLMACYMGGMAAGFILFSVISVKAQNKFKLCVVTSIFCNVFLIMAFNQPFFAVMATLIILSGLSSAIFNVLLNSTIQESTKQEVRGKVMAFLTMITQGFTPFAMALGGVLGGIFPIRVVITLAFTASLISLIPAYFSSSFRSYIKTDYSVDEKPQAA